MTICTPFAAIVTARANTAKKKKMQYDKKKKMHDEFRGRGYGDNSNRNTSSTSFFERLEQKEREREREIEERKKQFLNAYTAKFKLNKVASSVGDGEYEINELIIDFGFKTVGFETVYNGGEYTSTGYTNILILKNQFSDYIPVGTLHGYTKVDKFVYLHVCFRIEEDIRIFLDIKIQFEDAIMEDLLSKAVENHYNMASVHMFNTNTLLSESVENHYNMDSLGLL